MQAILAVLGAVVVALAGTILAFGRHMARVHERMRDGELD